MTSTLTVTAPNELEIDWSRELRAPRELVWATLTEPEHVRRWWGRKGSTLVVCDIDLRVGGAYRYVERRSDGSEYEFRGEYTEIAPPDRLAFKQILELEPRRGSQSLITIRLSERGGVTTLAGSVVFRTVKDRDVAVEAGIQHGMAESFDRLAELLAELRR